MNKSQGNNNYLRLTLYLRHNMEAIKQENPVSRSKSMGFLDKLDSGEDLKRFCGYSGCNEPRAGATAMDACYACAATDISVERIESGNGVRNLSVDRTLSVLEQKVDKLSELLEEQHELLLNIKENLIRSKVEEERHGSGGKSNTNEEDYEDSENFLESNETLSVGVPGCGSEVDDLHAVEVDQDQQSSSKDEMIRLALENFLQSDVAAAGAGALRCGLPRALAGAYVPLVQRSHRRLLKHVTALLDRAFADLEESTASLMKSIHRASRNIRVSLERHQSLLETSRPGTGLNVLRAIVEGVLHEELKSWRGKLLQELTCPVLCDTSGSHEGEDIDLPYVEDAPTSPKQPANPDMSPIDSLMHCALVGKRARDGDARGAFELALGARDLALVVAACRAAPAPPALRAPARLALLQQLATDMVHDTHLKCRYLEETIISLDNSDAATREHLPLVVGEVRKHLTRFLQSYPKHHASRRVALIVMAAENLLK